MYIQPGVYLILLYDVSTGLAGWLFTYFYLFACCYYEGGFFFFLFSYFNLALEDCIVSYDFEEEEYCFSRR